MTPLNDAVVHEYDLLSEVVDGCAITGQLETKAVDIYCLRKREYDKLIHDSASRMEWELIGRACSGVDYAVSFMRDYIWFNDENKGDKHERERSTLE